MDSEGRHRRHCRRGIYTTDASVRHGCEFREEREEAEPSDKTKGIALPAAGLGLGLTNWHSHMR